MEAILKQKKMEYMDHLTSNLDTNHEKTNLEKQTLVKLEKSFNILKPHFKAQLKVYLENIEYNVKKLEEKKEKDAAAKKVADEKKKKDGDAAEEEKPADNAEEEEEVQMKPVDSE